ncbi:MAG TPA: glycosyltransferase family 2 protein [Microlunatus sp.]|nr:glycosyltransferase family 2 protein [Microlunatus sp.]
MDAVSDNPRGAPITESIVAPGFHTSAETPRLTRPAYQTQRFLESVPALLLVLPVVLPIALAEYSPPIAYVAFSAYLAFWLGASLSLAVRQAREYRTMKRFRELDWDARLRHLHDPYARMHALADQARLTESEAEELEALHVWAHSGPEVPAPHEIHHLVVIPVYSEDRTIIEQSLEAILAADQPAERLTICLTFEARSPIWTVEEIDRLRSRYAGRFGRFLTTRHPDGLPGEGRVKGANISWGAQGARRALRAEGIRDEQVIVSAFDSDTRPSPHYFQVLTYTYLTNPNRDVDSYQPVLLFHNNAWEVTSASRLVGYIASMWTLVDSTRPKRLRIFSSHAMGMRALVAVNFWSTNVIPDDSRQYWRMYFGSNGRARTVPLHLPVYLDAVQSHSWWATMREQYRQIRRWSYGVIDFPYIMEQNLLNQRIPLRERAMQTFRQLSQFHLWATVPLLLLGLRFAVNAMTPTVTHSTAKLVELSSNANAAAAIITPISLIISAAVALSLLPRRPRHKGRRTWVKLVLEFLALPIVAPVFFCLPAIDAQVRLLFRRYLGFRVTVKLRSGIAHRIR